MLNYAFKMIIAFAAIIAFVASKPEAGVLFLILVQLITINEKLGKQDDTRNN